MNSVQRLLRVALAMSASAFPAFSGASPVAAIVPQVAISGLPLSFEPAADSLRRGVEYVAHGPQYAIALGEQGASLALGAHVIRLQLQGASGSIQPVAEQPLPGVVNYYIGNDPSQWRSGVKTFARVRYPGVYRGVDLVYYGTEGRLEYDFAVAPGASAAPIRLAFTGAQGVRVDARGNLEVRSNGHAAVFEHPVAYQMNDGRRTPVRTRYQLNGDTVRFKVGTYDHGKPLIIDPVLSYFSYLGGSANDVAGTGSPSGSTPSGFLSSQAAAVDVAGDLYVVGYTTSANFPLQTAYEASDPATTNLNNPTAFVSKFAPDAKSLIFSTYLGGSNGFDFAYAVALDAGGDAFVVGSVASNDFPITSGAYQTLCSATYGGSNGTTPMANCSDAGNNGQSGAFVSKFSPTGSLLASTFLGGENGGTAYAVAVDSAGRPYVAGSAYPGVNAPAAPYQAKSVGFPTTAGALVTPYAYCSGCILNGALQLDAFVSVFDPTLSTLLYSTLYGDNQGFTEGASLGNTQGTAITVDTSGSFYLAGFTSDAYLPVTSSAVQPQITSCGTYFPGKTEVNGNCGFVAKFSALGGGAPTLTYGTYLGHLPGCCANNVVGGIAADSAGDAYVVGYSDVATFPTTAGAYQPSCGQYPASNDTECGAAFIAKLNPAGTALLASTYFGGNYGGVNNISDNVSTVGPIGLDGSGNVYITGTAATGLPQVNGLTFTAASGDPFVAELNSSLTSLSFSTLLNGDAGQINVDGLALDTAGNIYVAGSSNTPATSPATSGALQAAYGGGSSDVFVAKIIVTTATKTTLTASPTTAILGAGISFTATVAEVGGSSVPTGSVTFKDGSTTVGMITLNSTGIAVYSDSALAVGAHAVTAVYSGDSANSASTSTAASVTVTAPAAPTVKIAVAPTSIVLGANATVTWSSTNATGCTASGAWAGTEPVSGTATITPTAAGAASYVLTCTGSGGSANATAALTVTTPAPTVMISVSPTTLTVGQSAMLTWSSTNATACTGSGAWSGTQSASGTATESPTATGASTFTLTCTGSGGMGNATAVLTVNAAAKSGGGAIGLWELLGLSFLGVAQYRRRAWRVRA